MSQLCDNYTEMITAVLVVVMVLMPFFIALMAASGVAIYRNRGKK